MAQIQLEIMLTDALKRERIDIVCPATVRMAHEDFINYLKYVWNVEADDVLWPRLESEFASSELYFFLNNWVSEWSYQWRKRVKVVADQKEIPTHPNRKPAPALPLELFNELKRAAIRTLIAHKLICGTVKLSEEVVKQSAAEVDKAGKTEQEWVVALLARVCKNARTLAQTTGVLLWMILPPKPIQEGDLRHFGLGGSK